MRAWPSSRVPRARVAAVAAVRDYVVARGSRFASGASWHPPPWSVEAGFAALVFFAVAIAMTWPLALHLGTRIPGGGEFYDPTGYYYDFWYFSTHGLQLVGRGTMVLLDQPFGRTIVPASYLEQFVSYGPGVVITRLWNPAAGLSIVAIVSLAGSGGAMYGLVRWLGAGKIAAIWAGVALMLSPYVTYRVGVHVPLADVACIPLTLLAGLAWMQRQTLGQALWVAAALIFAWLTNPYYGFMCVTIAMVIGVMGIGWAWRVRGARTALRRLVGLALCVAGLVGIPLLILLKTSGPAVQSVFGRSIAELSLYGAHVTDYVWPSHASRLMGWLFGGDWHGSPGGEATVFLGWSTMALAGLWTVIAWRRWRVTDLRRQLMTVAAGPLIIVLVLLSLASPYHIAGQSANAPSYFIFKVVPFIRAYGRFGGAVMVVVVVIAALGVDALVSRATRRNAVLVGGALIAISAIELPVALPIPSAPPLVVSGADSAPASQFAVWHWLAVQTPDGLLIELPTSSVEQYPYRGFMDRIYMFGQTLHHWPSANGGLGELSLGDEYGRLVGDPRYPDVAANLATAGVSLVVVNPWAYREAGQIPPDTSILPPGFALVRTYPDGTAIWRVTAAAKPGLAVFGTGFVREGTTDTWDLTQRSGTVTLYTRAKGDYYVVVALAGGGGSSAARVAINGGPSVVLPVAPGTAQPVWIAVHLGRGATRVNVRGIGAAGPAIVTQGWQLLPVNAPAS